MLEIFKTIDDKLVNIEQFSEGNWINLTGPSEEEILKVSEYYSIDIDYLKAALDVDERARIEFDNGLTFIIVDIPSVETEGNLNIYNTLPLGIVIIKDCIITVCIKKNPVVREFIKNKVKNFYTYFKYRFLLQILFKNALMYLLYLKHIDKMKNKLELELHKSMKNKILIQFMKIEKSLVYFSTSLKSNEIILEKLLKVDYIKKYPEDQELLEDVIIENKQAIEMTIIYSNILTGVMDAFASVISNNLNIVMKFLASVTIILAIPPIIANFYGMNVPIPGAANPHSFLWIIVISVACSVVALFILWYNKLF